MAEIFMQKIVMDMARSTDVRLKQAAEKAAKQRFNEAVVELQNDFEDHEVTKEIDDGIEASNRSHTLRGEGPTENLFSFIGFEAGTKPTEEIRKRLDPKDREGPYIEYVGKDTTPKALRFQFKVGIQEDKIWAATPLPWAKSMSWARKIEGKIQGFGSFLDRSGPVSKSNRSGGGTMAKEHGGRGPELQKLRTADYQRPEGGYLQTMFRKFLRKLGGK